VAKSLALHELQLATATVLARFDFERIGPEEKSLHMKEHISSSKVGQDGPMLRFRRLQTANYANSI
jgi:cytochrome P450